MLDQYFGTKELYEVVLKATTPMTFGSRRLEVGEPVLYFENVNMALLSEQSHLIMARGGWANMPRVIWEDRSEVQFSMTEGVMSSISFDILLSAQMTERAPNQTLYIQKREGPYVLQTHGDYSSLMYLEHWPTSLPGKKVFLYEYERSVAQRKVYGKYIRDIPDPFDDSVMRPCVQLYEDKACTQLADMTKEYIADYYFDYTDEALIYAIKKERFNGIFSLEGKFYSKDENEGLNYTNIIYMPRVRIVSDINLRLGERADPTTSVFNIIAMPEDFGGSRNSLILEITRLNCDIDGDI